MKQLFAVLAASMTVFFVITSTVQAAPPSRPGDADGPSLRNNADAAERDQRRMREERGAQRLKQHRWQAGYVMPQHYRGDGYKVEYRDYNLPRPARNQQWYKINNDYILVDSDSNDIIRIQAF